MDSVGLTILASVSMDVRLQENCRVSKSEELSVPGTVGKSCAAWGRAFRSASDPSGPYDPHHCLR